MYKIAVLSVLAVSVPFVVPARAADGGTLTDSERAFLIEQMEMSKKAFLASIDGITEAQWKFKPAPNVWSVQECAEHIVLSETYIFDSAEKLLQTPAVARPQRSNAQFDQQLAIGVQDRSHKATAPAPIDPVGRAATLTPEEARKQFTTKRNSNEEYVKSTSDDLRTHVGPGPVGPMDAYQVLILMATHTARHTEQIKEVEGNANYPGK